MVEVTRTTKSVIGVDPGCPLFLAMLSPIGKWVAHAGEEATATKDGSKWVNDPEKLLGILRKWVAHAGGPHKVVMVIERITLRPGQDLVSGAKFIGSYYSAITAAEALGIKVVSVHPRTWKTILGLSSVKRKSISRAYWLFPERRSRLKLESDHNYAEAALLAYYYREQLLKNMK